MSRTDPCGIHFHSFWVSRAMDSTLPLWLRIVSLAYSHHRKNGHAMFHLAGTSTMFDALKRNPTPSARRDVQRAIRTAVAKGFLAKGSNINCLVLPDDICGGAEGNAFADCKLHS